MNIFKSEMEHCADILDTENKKDTLESTLNPESFLKRFQNAFQNTPKILFVDDDPILCKNLKHKAKNMKLDITICNSVADVMRLPSQPQFDVAILDYFFGELTAFQLSHLLGHDIPVVLISNSEAHQISGDKWPAEVKSFVPKKLGVEAILGEALFNTRWGRTATLAQWGNKVLNPGEKTKKLLSFVFAAILLGLFGLSGLYLINKHSTKNETKLWWKWDQAPVSPLSGYTLRSHPLKLAQENSDKQ